MSTVVGGVDGAAPENDHCVERLQARIEKRLQDAGASFDKLVAALQSEIGDEWLRLWCKQRRECWHCNETFSRDQVRYDRVSPGADASKYICRWCWEYWRHGLSGLLAVDCNGERGGGGGCGSRGAFGQCVPYDPPLWPVALPPLLYDGFVYDTQARRIVGIAKMYNFSTHAAQTVAMRRVVRLEHASSGGALPATCVVLAFNANASARI